jgi:hypothetical protein
VIADSPDATLLTPACAWCEQPLRAAVPARIPAPIRCAVCGSRTGTWPSDAQLAAFVPRAARPASEHHRCTLAEAARRRARRRLAERVARIAPPGPVLDVGSGDGLLLDALHRAGRAANGIERPATRPDVHDADITELGGRYAAIVFWESLGRLRAPRASLEHAVSLLKPEGLLTIAQPTAVGLPVLTERWRRDAPEPPRVQIPASALVERLRMLGLEVRRTERLGQGRDLLGGWLPALLGGVVAIEARR